MTLSFDAHPRSSLIVALDFDSLSSAAKFAKQVSDLVGMFKIGNQLFTAAGPAAVKDIAALGPGIFLDLKFHDIPNTVAGAVLSAAAMTGVQLVNVHALGGRAMLEAAVQAISAGVPMGADRPRLLAVTLLTSMDHRAMKEVGIGGEPKLRVVKLAHRIGQDDEVRRILDRREQPALALRRPFLFGNIAPGQQRSQDRAFRVEQRPSPDADPESPIGARRANVLLSLDRLAAQRRGTR